MIGIGMAMAPLIPGYQLYMELYHGTFIKETLYEAKCEAVRMALFGFSSMVCNYYAQVAYPMLAIIFGIAGSILFIDGVLAVFDKTPVIALIARKMQKTKPEGIPRLEK
jgi:hypothetical protein